MLVVAGVVLGAGLFVLGSGSTAPPGSPAATGPPTSGNVTPPLPPVSNGSSDLVLTVITDYPDYFAGEPFAIAVRLDNAGNETEAVYVAGCPSGFVVQDSDFSSVYDSAAHTMCSPKVTLRILHPGDSIQDYFTWDQKNDSEIQVPAPAWYRIVGRWNGESDPIKVVPRSNFIGVPVSRFQLAFSIRTDRETYALGETANVSVTLTNVGNDTAVLNFPNACVVQYLVFNESGGEVYNTTHFWGCIQMLWGFTLASGASKIWGMPWDLTTNQWTPVLAPGTYRLVPSFVWYEPGYQRSVVHTGTVTITVNP